ncbi:hypothetical protein J2128_000615 [Methanomicrobium sp. W14]|uniref:DUF6508 domain-containing protein n=1 Tax=Methanomicrobium sp. W14 TaxID=2817839 RepID=UPI001AEA7CD4|nr:DUF6508 domain-containing protein [Methanomicrobium sp. W14]MBP2132694.1 hypothetical protein [Methanomicrobium sp. W14]
MNREGEIPAKENFEAIIKCTSSLKEGLITEKNREEIENSGTCREIMEFTKTLYYNNWLINTRWQDWTSEAEFYFGNPDRISTAGIETLRRILTVHVRIDRLFPGEIADLISRGYILLILERINELYATEYSDIRDN